MEERIDRVADQKKTVTGRFSLLGLLERGAGATDRWLNYIGVSFVIFLMLLVLSQVVARYFFNSPIRGYIDAMEMMMVVLVFLTLAYCQGKGGHIRVELFMTRVLKEGSRRYHVVEFLHLLLSLVAFALIAIYGAKEALDAYPSSGLSLTVFWPTWPARMVLAVGSIFLCVRLIVQMIQNLNWAVVGVKKTELLGAEREA